MTTFYSTGTKRIVYKSINCVTGLTVTGYIWNPSLTKSALQTFTEVSDGIYILDFAFSSYGTWFGKFYESGLGTVVGTYNVVSTSGFGVASGVGSETFTYTLISDADASPIADADVWITSDVAGANVLASGKTDQYGKVTFYLDIGTVYVWRQKSGWDFTNPDTEIVS